MTAPERQLEGATIRGRMAGADGIEEYLGIRFAQAPTGPLRFCAPVAVAPRGVVDAVEFGPAAPQLPGSETVPGDTTPERMDEDCLFLNVWAPATPGRRPVFVWFYGGGFLSGATSDPTINGAALAARGDMVVVSIAYRVGALGFLGLGDTNCGLRDQQCGLQWVRDHIEAFGGDPGNVTIAGESAGGGSVLHLLASPATVGLFRHAIVQSGATEYTRSRADVDRVTELYLAALDGDDPRQVPWGRIIEAQGQALMPMMLEMARMPFHPCVDADFLPARPVDALAQGVGRDVDLVIGTTADEMRLFLMEAGLADVQMRKRVDRYLGRDASALVGAYKAIVGDDPMDVWAAIFSDREMQLPALAVADSHQGHTWRYLFTWEVAPRADGLPLRACHAADIPFPFGSLGRLGWDTWTGADADPVAADALVDAMQAAWCGLARDGDPGWPEHQTGAVMQFGRTLGPGPDLLADRLARWS